MEEMNIDLTLTFGLKTLFGRTVLDFEDRLSDVQKEEILNKYKKHGCLYFYDIVHKNEDPTSDWIYISNNSDELVRYVSTIMVTTRPFEKDFSRKCPIVETEYEDTGRRVGLEKFTRTFYVTPAVAKQVDVKKAEDELVLGEL